MSNVYYGPEKLGLESFGEIDWSDGNYVFDITAVWRRKSDGVFLFASDSGCSCPTPFEDAGIGDLEACGPISAFQRILEERQQSDQPRTDKIAQLIERMRAAGAR